MSCFVDGALQGRSKKKKESPCKSTNSEKEGSDEVYTLEKIVGHFTRMEALKKAEIHKTIILDGELVRNSCMGYVFRVRWAGYEADADTYEPLENFSVTSYGALREYCSDNSIRLPINAKDRMQKVSDDSDAFDNEDHEPSKSKQEGNDGIVMDDSRRKEPEGTMPTMSSLFGDEEVAEKKEKKEEERRNRDEEDRRRERKRKKKEEKERRRLEEARKDKKEIDDKNKKRMEEKDRAKISHSDKLPGTVKGKDTKIGVHPNVHHYDKFHVAATLKHDKTGDRSKIPFGDKHHGTTNEKSDKPRERSKASHSDKFLGSGAEKEDKTRRKDPSQARLEEIKRKIVERKRMNEPQRGSFMDFISKNAAAHAEHNKMSAITARLRAELRNKDGDKNETETCNRIQNLSVLEREQREDAVREQKQLIQGIKCTNVERSDEAMKLEALKKRMKERESTSMPSRPISVGHRSGGLTHPQTFKVEKKNLFQKPLPLNLSKDGNVKEKKVEREKSTEKIREAEKTIGKKVEKEKIKKKVEGEGTKEKNVPETKKHSAWDGDKQETILDKLLPLSRTPSPLTQKIEVGLPKTEETGKRANLEDKKKEIKPETKKKWLARKKRRCIKRLRLIIKMLRKFDRNYRKKESIREGILEQIGYDYMKKMKECGGIELRIKREVPDEYCEKNEEKWELEVFARRQKVKGRTLRRCLSTEMLPLSFRPQNTIGPVEHMKGQSGSVARAMMLADYKHGIFRRRLRIIKKKRRAYMKKQNKRRKMNEMRRKLEKRALPVCIKRLVNMCVKRSRKRARQVNEETVIELIERIACAYVTMDISQLVPALENVPKQLKDRIVVKLVHYLTPVIKLLNSDDLAKTCCDGGEHRKCRILLCVLLSVRNWSTRIGGLFPMDTLHKAIDTAALCQIRALLRAGFTFTEFADESTGLNAAQKILMRENLYWIAELIERGLDVNTFVIPKSNSEIKMIPYSIYKKDRYDVYTLCRIYSDTLIRRSIEWTREFFPSPSFFLRPITPCHVANPFARTVTVQTAVVMRKDYVNTGEGAVVLAVHLASVIKGHCTQRKKKKEQTTLTVQNFKVTRPVKDAVDEKSHFKIKGIKMIIRCEDKKGDQTIDEVSLDRIKETETTTLFAIQPKWTTHLLEPRCVVQIDMGVHDPYEYTLLIVQLMAIERKKLNPLYY